MKGIILNIYRDSYRCELNKFDHVTGVTLPCEGGIFEPSEAAPEIKLVRRNIFGKDYIHAEPANKEQGEYFAAGGSFVYTSDARYAETTGIHYPISLHDRRMNLEK